MLGGNLGIISNRFDSQSFKVATKSQMNVWHSCANLDNPCTTFNKGKTQAKSNKVSAHHKKLIIDFCSRNNCRISSHFHN